MSRALVAESPFSSIRDIAASTIIARRTRGEWRAGCVAPLTTTPRRGAETSGVAVARPAQRPPVNAPGAPRGLRSAVPSVATQPSVRSPATTVRTYEKRHREPSATLLTAGLVRVMVAAHEPYER